MPESTGTERRRAPRRRVNTPLTLVVDSDASQVTSGAFAVDLSQLGARLRAQIHLEPGQLITVVPGGGAGPKVSSRVVWISDEGQGCSAGVAFLQPVSLEQLASHAG
jgi:PilZ domain